MPTGTGQVTVSGTPTAQNPATFQVTAQGAPTQTQVGLVPSMLPNAFYQQVPVNALAQGQIAGNSLLFGGLTLALNAPEWTLISGQGGPGFVGGAWEMSTGGGAQSSRALPTQGAFYRSGSGAGGGGGADDSEITFDNGTQISRSRLSGFSWLVLGFLVTLLLTDKGR